MASTTVTRGHDAATVAGLLDSPEISALITRLEQTRWTGRPGYPIRAMVGVFLTRSVYIIPTLTRTVALVREHSALRDVLGAVPSVDACYRFSRKLRKHDDMLSKCIDSVLDSLRAAMPGMGEIIAIDGSDMPAYANGHRHKKPNGEIREHYSDPDASWGHRSSISTRAGGGYYGHKLHVCVCTKTGLPLAWTVRTAKDPERAEVAGLLDETKRRGFTVSIGVLDKGYDGTGTHKDLESRDIRPVIPLRETAGVKAGFANPPACKHGVWTFAGADTKRHAAKYRCPTGECTPASTWLRASRMHPLIPRDSDRYKKLYNQRGAVEREFGTLKHEYGLLPLRVRGLERVRLHVNLTILTQLAAALGATRTTT